MKATIQRNTTYSAGITSATGALFHREINALLPLIQSVDHEKLLKLETFENKFLLINAESSRRKSISHICARIKYAFPGFWENYASSTIEEQSLMLFYLALSSVTVIYDFHFGVTLPAWKGSSRLFDPFNYQMKLDKLADESAVVDKWFTSTRVHIIQIYKRMLKDAGFLNNELLVQPKVADGFYFPFLKNHQPWFLEACFLNQTECDRINHLYKLTI